MRAVVHHEFGDPSAVLTVEEVPTPEPGAGEVRVRTVLATVHNHDLMTIRGVYGFKPGLPARAGTEAVGIVDALGEGVENLTVGQRVVAGAFGVWAEYFIAPAAGLVPVGPELPDEVAAQLVAMPFSTLGLLDWLGLAEGDWLAQNAANGAVGRMLAQVAKARGINVLGLVRRAAGVDELAAQGIGNVVATDGEDWKAEVEKITGGAPIRVGVESIGGSAAGDLASLLAENGQLVIFGAMAAPVLEIPSRVILFNNVVVKGYWGGREGRAIPADKRSELFSELITRVTDGSMTLPAESVLSFEDIGAVDAANARPGRVGKVLLRP
jgi:NADPH2:quinone reductase